MKNTLSQLTPHLLNMLGWTLVVLLAGPLTLAALETKTSPFSFVYGEGIMAWGTYEVSKGHWPYGDINAIPSRYSAYGPLTYVAAGFIAALLPDHPLRFIEAGRILTILSWIIGGITVGIATRNKALGIATLALLLLTPITLTVYFWAFRMDALLFALQALLALTFIRGGPTTLKFTVPALICAIVLTKPPAAIDIMPLFLAALALRQDDPLTNLKSLWLPTALGIVLAPTLFFLLDALSGQQMSNNILWQQAHSGTIAPHHYHYNTGLWTRAESIPLLIAATLGTALLLRTSSPQKTGLLILAATLSFLFSTLTCLKEGADLNYLFPSLVPLGLAAGLLLEKIPRSATLSLLCLTVPLQTFSLEPPHYEKYKPTATSTIDFKTLVEKHQQKNFLSEDVFYSVAARQTPLVTDLFQLEIHLENQKISPAPLLTVAQGAWGGERLCSFLNTSLQKNPHAKDPSKRDLVLKKTSTPVTPMATGGGPWQDTFYLNAPTALTQNKKTKSLKEKTSRPASPLPLLIPLLGLTGLGAHLCLSKKKLTTQKKGGNSPKENPMPS